jgi:hypothetical protein
VINFRYHVVSLTAVFLALAIGLIVGTAALNGPAANDLHDRVNALSKSNSQYRATVTRLTQDVNSKEQFATELAPELLANKLAGHSVVVMSMPETANLVAGLDTMLGLSGAKISAHVELEDSFVDPSNSAPMLQTAQLWLDTAALSGIPNNSDGVETSTAVLAAALMDHDPVVNSNSRDQLLSAYEHGGYIKVDGSSTVAAVPTSAESVIFLAPQPYTDANAATENKSLITIVTQLNEAPADAAQLTVSRPIVVGAAGASGSGNVIGAVIGDATLSKNVSTVDNADTQQGLIAIVLALSEQVDTDQAGHYGVSSGATSMLPKYPEG